MKALPTERSHADAPERKHLFWAGAQVLAVVGVLILGAILSSDSPPDPVRPPVGPDEAPVALSAAPQPEFGASAAALQEDAAARLAPRVQRDVERLDAAGHDWTAQLAVLCDIGQTERMVRLYGADPAFYVLPKDHADQPCFRICWSHYRTRQQAKDARDLPAALRSFEPNPVPKSVEQVLQ